MRAYSRKSKGADKRCKEETLKREETRHAGELDCLSRGLIPRASCILISTVRYKYTRWRARQDRYTRPRRR